MPTFRAIFRHLPRTIVSVFTGRNWFWHVLAIALTYLLVMSGFDWWYFQETRSDLLFSLTLPAGIIGFFVPIFLSVGMLIYGSVKKNTTATEQALVVTQAGIIGWLVSSTYKAFTGRVEPEFFTYTNFVDNSNGFQFGFMEHGIFWGWPSSHTAVAFAMSVALVLLYPKSRLVKYFALLYALYIGVGVSVSIHWFSDFVAGAIVGSLVGVVAVRSYRTRLAQR